MVEESYLLLLHDVFDVIFFVVVTTFCAAFVDFFLLLRTLIVVLIRTIIHVIDLIHLFRINLKVLDSLIDLLVVLYLPDVNSLVGIVCRHLVLLQSLANEVNLRLFFLQLSLHCEELRPQIS